MATQTAAGARRRFSVDDCRAMVKAGILSPDERIELRDGQPFRKDKGLRRRFSVDEYYAMAQAGILAPDERVELLAGEIITMAPIGAWHAACVADFDELLQESVGRRANKQVQSPLRLTDEYVPEPDLMLLRRRADSYRTSTPRPADVLLLIEVADSTISTDRQRKLSAYARAGIPEVWLANRTARNVEVHAEPVNGVYTRVAIVGSDGSLTPQVFPDVIIPVSAVMPD